MVLLDLQKAFDTVDHGILIQKLKALGLDGGVIGSILAPILFLMYVNDIPSAVKCKLLLYADYSALIVPGNNTKEIQQEFSNELESIREWLIDNKLSLHLGKTESILFASKRKLQKYNSIQVQYVGNVLTCWTKVKYLGVKLDQSLAGDCIADKIISKFKTKVSI